MAHHQDKASRTITPVRITVWTRFCNYSIILILSGLFLQILFASHLISDSNPLGVEANCAVANDNHEHPPSQHRAVYLHFEGKKTAEQIKKLMTGYRLDCRPLPVEDLDASSLQDVDLIIVDAATKDAWEMPSAVKVIKDSKLPVFAMGEGGAELLGKLDLRIGVPNGQLRKVTPLKPNSEAIFWDAFQPELVEGVYEFSSKGEQFSLKVNGTSEDVVILATESEHQDFSPLIVQKPHYLLWGFNGTYDQMTGTGRQLFAWACYYSMAMKEHPDRAFMSKSEVERIKEKQK